MQIWTQVAKSIFYDNLHHNDLHYNRPNTISTSTAINLTLLAPPSPMTYWHNPQSGLAFDCPVRTLLFLTPGQVSISQVEQKTKTNKKQREGGRKEGRKDKTQMPNYTKERKVCGILAFFVCVNVAITRILWKSQTATKTTDSSLRPNPSLCLVFMSK